MLWCLSQQAAERKPACENVGEQGWCGGQRVRTLVSRAGVVAQHVRVLVNRAGVVANRFTWTVPPELFHSIT